jgi:hypothetical protein
MGYGLMIWNMTVSIWDILSLCGRHVLSVRCRCFSAQLPAVTAEVAVVVTLTSLMGLSWRPIFSSIASRGSCGSCGRRARHGVPSAEARGAQDFRV